MALVIIAGLLAYINTFQTPFVFDDLTNITGNETIRNLGAVMNGWDEIRFLGMLTFAINYQLHGLTVAGYHLFNLVVHITTALLVFWLVMLTMRTPLLRESRLGRSERWPLAIALFASLIFVVHPVQTQAVTYIVQRLASMAALFFLLSLVMYAWWRLRVEISADATGGGGNLLIFAASLVSALLAMSTKETAFTLPFIVALWEFAFFRGSMGKRMLHLLPFAVTLLVIPLSLLVNSRPLTSAAGFGETPSTPDYLFTQVRVIVTYLRLLVLPIDQNIDYDYPVYHSPFAPAVLISAVFLLSLIGLAVLLWRISGRGSDLAPLRLVSFGIFWFFITISVESSFIAIADVIFEHRLYLPSIGLVIAVVTAGGAVAWSLKHRAPFSGKVMIGLAAVIVMVLSAAAYSRNQVWEGPVRLWEDTVSKSPEKARPHQVLAYYYYNSGRAAEAESENLKAISIKPDYADALNSLGVIYLDSGRYDQAEETLKRALAISPGFVDAHYNLGLVYLKSDRMEEAESELNLVVKAAPDHIKAWQHLAAMYIYQERYQDATGPLQKVIELDPYDYLAYNDLGNIYAMQGRYAEAMSKYRTALSINPDFQEARDNLMMLQGPTS